MVGYTCLQQSLEVVLFTGLVETIGNVRQVKRERGGLSLLIEASFETGPLKCGESIATAGVCLTAEEVTTNGFRAFASQETVVRTTLSFLKIGDRVNLERAMRLDQRLGGHIVTGHVDGVGRVRRLAPAGEAIALTIEPPADVRGLVTVKGAIAIDGVSLTVNAVSGQDFTVMLIPHTLKSTTLGTIRPGHKVNVEADIIARYVASIIKNMRGFTVDGFEDS